MGLLAYLKCAWTCPRQFVEQLGNLEHEWPCMSRRRKALVFLIGFLLVGSIGTMCQKFYAYNRCAKKQPPFRIQDCGMILAIFGFIFAVTDVTMHMIYEEDALVQGVQVFWKYRSFSFGAYLIGLMVLSMIGMFIVKQARFPY